MIISFSSYRYVDIFEESAGRELEALTIQDVCPSSTVVGGDVCMVVDDAPYLRKRGQHLRANWLQTSRGVLYTVPVSLAFSTNP